jgi:hypothetical protein
MRGQRAFPALFDDGARAVADDEEQEQHRHPGREVGHDRERARSPRPAPPSAAVAPVTARWIAAPGSARRPPRRRPRSPARSADSPPCRPRRIRPRTAPAGRWPPPPPRVCAGCPDSTESLRPRGSTITCVVRPGVQRRLRVGVDSREGDPVAARARQTLRDLREMSEPSASLMPTVTFKLKPEPNAAPTTRAIRIGAAIAWMRIDLSRTDRRSPLAAINHTWRHISHAALSPSSAGTPPQGRARHIHPDDLKTVVLRGLHRRRDQRGSLLATTATCPSSACTPLTSGIASRVGAPGAHLFGGTVDRSVTVLFSPSRSHEFSARPLRDEPAGVDDPDPVAEPLGLLHVVRRVEHGHAGTPSASTASRMLLRLCGSTPTVGSSRMSRLRFVQQTHRDVRPALHAPRVGLDAVLGPVGEPTTSRTCPRCGP